MAFTIYTVSDPSTIGGALQSMAMFFGQEDTVGTAIKTALMLSLIFILAQGVTRNGLKLDVMLIQLIVVWGMFMPKTTVTIEQFDNAAPPRVVDGVPYAIALPGAIAGAFALYMTRNIEATMISVDGDYLSISGGSHPFTPARSLMAITMCPSDPFTCVDQSLVETMRLAARFCANGELTDTKFSNEPNVLEKFASKLTKQAQVFIFDKANPYIPGGGGGRPASCPEVAQYLIDVAMMEKAGSGSITDSMGSLASRAEIKKYNVIARAEDKVEKNWDLALQDINKTRDANSKLDSLAFANVTLYSLADALKFDAGAPLDQSITLRRDLGLFEWAKAEATQSMLVSTTAPKFMDILFFVFIASTPIVMFVVAANPSGGLKVAGSYALFGMWTQSWIPMMAIVMSWYQGELKNISSPLKYDPEYMAFYMRHVYSTTIAASNMLQQAPYIMFAIMTGSMMAMSGLVSKAMPSGGKGGAGVGVGGGSAVSDPITGALPKGAISGAQARSAILGAQSILGGGGGIMSSSSAITGDGAQGYSSLPTLNVGDGVQTQANSANRQSAALQKQLQTQSQQAYTEMAQTLKSAADKIGGDKLASLMTNAGVKSSFNSNTGQLVTGYGTYDLKTGQMVSTGQEGQAKTEVAAKAGFELFGTGATVAGAVAAALKDAVTQSVHMGNSRGVQRQDSSGATNGNEVTNGTQAQSSSNSRRGTEISNLASKAQSLQTQFSKLASASQSLTSTDEKMNQAGAAAGADVSRSLSGAEAVTRWNAAAFSTFGSNTNNDGIALNRVASIAASSLSPEQRSQLDTAARANLKTAQANGAAIGYSADQNAMAATWSALSDMASNAKTPEEKIGAQVAMAELHKAAGGTDASAGLKAVRDGIAAVAGVQQQITDMANVVKPSADAASAGAERHLNPATQNKFNREVGDAIKAREAKAEATAGTAEAGLKKVQTQGEKVKDAESEHIRADQQKKLNIAPLGEAARQAVDNISAIPTRSDMVPLAAGHNVSVGHMDSGRTEDGRNKGNLGAEGGHGIAPLTTHADKDKVNAANTAAWFSQTVPGSTNKTKDAASRIGNSIAGGAQAAGQAASNTALSAGAATSVVIKQGESSSSLPNLDLKGGLDLSRSGGGGDQMPMLTDKLKPKPYAAGVGRDTGDTRDTRKKSLPRR